MFKCTNTFHSSSYKLRLCLFNVGTFNVVHGSSIDVLRVQNTMINVIYCLWNECMRLRIKTEKAQKIISYLQRCGYGYVYDKIFQVIKIVFTIRLRIHMRILHLKNDKDLLNQILRHKSFIVCYLP